MGSLPPSKVQYEASRPFRRLLKDAPVLYYTLGLGLITKLRRQTLRDITDLVEGNGLPLSEKGHSVLKIQVRFAVKPEALLLGLNNT